MHEDHSLKLDRLGPRVGVAGNNDPSLPSTAPRNSFSGEHTGIELRKQKKKRCTDFCYNRETKEYCGRTCKSWLSITCYGIVYLMFLTSYTLAILYISLLVLQSLVSFDPLEPSLLSVKYPEIGLTATPASELSYPLIWYKQKENNDYDKYVQAIDKFLLSRKQYVNELGPCGRSPYGYGDSPCVILRINKNFFWAGKALEMNSTVTSLAPPEVIKWMKIKKNRLWMHCRGYYPYDQEHIGRIKYYPDPPGIDPGLFPLKQNSTSPLIAIQISNFTRGISLAIECKLWHQSGPTSTEFVLYVAPEDAQVYPEIVRANL
ncbi:sodium/potassium-transporting ATPase subunit beta-2-like [Anticarsia gemmatalis]|uniref:sodium/potassium-transporting ATPase subunit beta-2-like n=1 Tax=Anticarsia gemmatalis TaxID=129554 RepID=UPI003F761FE5